MISSASAAFAERKPYAVKIDTCAQLRQSEASPTAGAPSTVIPDTTSVEYPQAGQRPARSVTLTDRPIRIAP